MKTVKKNIIFIVLAAVLMIIIFFCFSQSVYSQGRNWGCALDKESMDEAERIGGMAHRVFISL